MTTAAAKLSPQPTVSTTSTCRRFELPAGNGNGSQWVSIEPLSVPLIEGTAELLAASFVSSLSTLAPYAQVYQASVESQKRMSAKLAEANSHMAYLERRLDEATRDLQDASAFLKKVAMEFGTTGRMVESTAAAVRFGVDKEDGVDKLVKLCDRLEALEDQRAAFTKRVPKKVPVAWVGVASEVKLMGDFDGWTRGFELSAGSIDSDGVIKTFEAQVPLLPGRYLTKFMVDGGWRLAGDWPTENNELGETNNVMIVSA
ncbi:hypothetical protein TSOC_006786 [Tetrabaena socialis]|uniref:AMP-activated protein kinase glycogen-binding domain-containing protein n=1 Tax=Tetrabaena socialis TaxID=47790 RepID=A0A2J8A2T0_9CHLO|nr:hypothetical protein TSOC_006786 [Tetrabaena socialis]|eukprot:PNH06798.1 hypothetical protein TSOC_006786 [Tetrabaena socialis]